jgi:hypothetical protein
VSNALFWSPIAQTRVSRFLAFLAGFLPGRRAETCRPLYSTILRHTPISRIICQTSATPARICRPDRSPF